MSKFKIRQTFTPEDASQDRERRVLVFDSKNVEWLEVLKDGLRALGWKEKDVEEITYEPNGQLDDADGETGIEYQDFGQQSNNGSFLWEVDQWGESRTTTDQIWEWAEKQAAEETKKGDPTRLHSVRILMCVIGRQYWAMIDQWKPFDLKQTLHELEFEGMQHKPIQQRNKDELLAEALEIAVMIEEEYDPSKETEPLTFEWVLKQRPDLWYDESKGERR